MYSVVYRSGCRWVLGFDRNRSCMTYCIQDGLNLYCHVCVMKQYFRFQNLLQKIPNIVGFYTQLGWPHSSADVWNFLVYLLTENSLPLCYVPLVLLDKLYHYLCKKICCLHYIWFMYLKMCKNNLLVVVS